MYLALVTLFLFDSLQIVIYRLFSHSLQSGGILGSDDLPPIDRLVEDLLQLGLYFSVVNLLRKTHFSIIFIMPVLLLLIGLQTHH